MAFNFDLSPLDDIATGDKLNTKNDGSGKTYRLQATVTFDGTQSNADVIPLFIVHGTDIITGGGYYNAALAGMTDIDLGLYDLDGNAVDADFFVDGDSLASAQTTRYGDDALSATNVSAAGDEQTQLGDLSADVDTTRQYVVAMTLNTAGSASGAFRLRYDVIRSN